MLVDTHVHLDFYDNAQEINAVVERAIVQEVKVLIAVGYDFNSCKKAVELAGLFSQVYAAVGIHPHEASTITPQLLKDISSLATNKRVVAYGEIGLDFYRNRSPREKQKEAFRQQIRLAQKLSLPLIIHSRDAHIEVLKILDEEKASEVAFHCFSGGGEVAKECLARNYYLSVAGPVTFYNAKQLRETVKSIPINKLLLETDSPFLAPHPYRGKTNEPSYLPLIARAVGEVKELSGKEVAEATSENAFTFFGLNNIVLKS